jgi:hypothetical protein
MSVGSDIELYDSEIKEIEAVLLRLNDKVGASVDYEAFTREIVQRFEDIEPQGFIVRVAWYEFARGGKKVEGAYMPEITITGRTERPGEFDHGRLAHEIRENILELPGQEKGLIKADKETMRRFISEHGKHSHGD